MAKLYVPACGDRITLVKPWEFKLYLEYRNTVFGQVRGLYTNNRDHDWSVYLPNGDLASVPCLLDAGTVLECDRIYIRATSKSADSVDDNYDSISWKVIINNKAAVKQRFWAKLSDCYNIDFDPSNVSTYQSRK